MILESAAAVFGLGWLAMVMYVRSRARPLLQAAKSPLFCAGCLYELDAEKTPTNCPECGIVVPTHQRQRWSWLSFVARAKVCDRLFFISCILFGVFFGALAARLGIFTARSKTMSDVMELCFMFFVGVVPFFWAGWFSGIFKLQMRQATAERLIRAGF